MPFPDNCALVTILRDGQVYTPSAEQPLEAGDELLFVADQPGDIARIGLELTEARAALATATLPPGRGARPYDGATSRAPVPGIRSGGAAVREPRSAGWSAAARR